MKYLYHYIIALSILCAALSSCDKLVNNIIAEKEKDEAGKQEEIDEKEETDEKEVLDQIFFSDDFIEGSNTVILKNGYAIVDTPDTIGHNHYLYLDSLDFNTGNLCCSEPLCIYCDSLYRPQLFIVDGIQYFVKSYDRESLTYGKIVDGEVIECGE